MITTNQMFGKIARDAAARERDELDRKMDEARRAREAEERLDAPLTRREMLEAIEAVKDSYSPHHHSTQIELFERLLDRLA